VRVAQAKATQARLAGARDPSGDLTGVTDPN
jgi:hypothetical protein